MKCLGTILLIFIASIYIYAENTILKYSIVDKKGNVDSTHIFSSNDFNALVYLHKKPKYSKRDEMYFDSSFLNGGIILSISNSKFPEFEEFYRFFHDLPDREWLITCGQDTYILDDITYSGNAIFVYKGDSELIINKLLEFFSYLHRNDWNSEDLTNVDLRGGGISIRISYTAIWGIIILFIVVVLVYKKLYKKHKVSND